jgi:protein-S-isoprenylcysteine O-methyltransferase Ste14
LDWSFCFFTRPVCPLSIGIALKPGFDFRAFVQYRVRSFLGLATDQNDFVRSGILTYVRHPLYSGIILVSLGYLLFVPSTASLISAGCIFLYLPIGIWLEERKLLRHFGDAYRQYRAKVPALVPRWPWR